LPVPNVRDALGREPTKAKAFLDPCPNQAVTGVTAVPVITGGNELHGMAVDIEKMVELYAVVDQGTRENLRHRAVLGPRIWTESQ
jgi:hypothetical protein